MKTIMCSWIFVAFVIRCHSGFAKMNVDHILHRELSYEIVGVLMDVHNALGPGWDEYPYHEAVLEGLNAKGLQAAGKLGGKLQHRDLLADVFELDILVENCVILELKHLDTGFAEAHFVQIINYLKFWRKDLGILVNFGHERLRYQRVPYTPIDGAVRFDGPWQELQQHSSTATTAAAMFKYILQQHGLGYGVDCNRKLFAAESQFRGISCRHPTARLSYGERDLG